MSRRKLAAFTLIEIIIVLAITAILTAMLLPALVQVGEKGRQTVCSSNLRQVGIALQMYMQDHAERIPGSNGDVADFAAPGTRPNFLLSLLPYTGSVQILACPSAGVAPGADAPSPSSDTNYLGNGVVAGRSANALRAPDSTIFLQENLVRSKNAYLRPLPVSGGFAQWHSNEGSGERFSVTHLGGGNLLFCDGHVKWRKAEAMRSGDFGLLPADDDIDAPASRTYSSSF